MSDLCMYELEDNVWDEFGESDDHLVPHPVDKHENQCAAQVGSHKKVCREVIGVTSTVDYETKYVIDGKEDTSLQTLTKRVTMLEKGSWSHTPDGAFTASRKRESLKEGNSIASDDTWISAHSSKSGNIDTGGSEFCGEDSSLGEKCAAVGNDSFNYTLSNISESDNDLSFFDNDREDKESNELLYYGWPDIGNFEDVDGMFRSCETAFGLGSLSNEDDLCWFPSSHDNEGSENALKSSFMFSSSDSSALKSVSDDHEASRQNNAGPPINVSTKKSLSTSEKLTSQSADADDCGALSQLSFLNGSDTKSDSQYDSMHKEQVNLLRKHSRNQSQSKGKRKDRYPGNGVSFLHHCGTMKPCADVKNPCGEISHQSFSSTGIQQHKQNVGSDSLSYLQTHVPYMHLNYSHLSDQISVCPSGAKLENNGHLYLSPKESSYASNQVQSMESSYGPFDAHAITENKKRERIYRSQDLQNSFGRNLKCKDMVSSDVICHPVSVQKQVHSENENEGHSEVEGLRLGIAAELDCSNIQESSCISSVLDEISLEASSFRQLQQVMEQLDLRTKLCIRDSLYRLARSAEQRHNGEIRDDKDASGALIVEETNKCTGYLDMETDTNPIDRSIAHLLFHRPSDPSLKPANDGMPLKSPAMIRGSVTSPPVTAEKQGCQEETAAGSDNNSLTSDNKQ